MKKIIFSMCLVILFSSAASFGEVYNANYVQNGAISLQLPYYTKFYDIDTINIKAEFKQLTKEQERNLTKAQKDVYKKIKKIEKHISKKNYRKALEEDSSFIPTHIQYMNYSLSLGDYHEALNELFTIQRLNNTDKIFDNDKINYKIGMLHYLNRNYTSALNYLSPFIDKYNPSVENLWFALSDIHYNLNNFSTSIFYAKKITPYSINFLGAQELLYNSYYNLNNMKEANTYARILVSSDPTPINYMRLGTTSSDNNSKLTNYYKAREIALQTQNYTALGQADLRIAVIEQAKIDAAVKPLTAFVEKPSWDKILKDTVEITKPEDISERQKQFFESTNACIAKYKGNELVKCFEHVNSEQKKLTEEVKAEYQRAYEERQRALEFQRQQMLIREQTYFQRMYLNDFWYMRHPYWFGYW